MLLEVAIPLVERSRSRDSNPGPSLYKSEWVREARCPAGASDTANPLQQRDSDEGRTKNGVAVHRQAPISSTSGGPSAVVA